MSRQSTPTPDYYCHFSSISRGCVDSGLGGGVESQMELNQTEWMQSFFFQTVMRVKPVPVTSVRAIMEFERNITQLSQALAD